MPLPAYMTIKGSVQGLISQGALGKQSVGTAQQTEHEDEILVQKFDHSIFVPHGTSTGRRAHRPLVITKGLDTSSPRLNMALCSAEPLTVCRLACYRVAGDNAGKELFYTVELTGAVIVGIELVMPHYLDPAAAHMTQLEHVHIAYQTISWRHEITTTQGQDQWQEGQ